MSLAAVAGATAHAADAAFSSVNRSVNINFGKLPMSFEPNRGQADAQVQYLSRGPGYQLYLAPGKAVLQLKKGANEGATIGMTLVGADTRAAAAGEDLLPGTVNYFEGQDPARWQTAVPTYKRVAYKAVYPGVDVVYYGRQRELEYDFVVAPGADANRIALSFTGSQPHVDAATGDLVLPVAESETRFHKPVVYQMDGARKREIAANYTVVDGQVRFALGAYDHNKALVIDPVLSYLTYLGATVDDTINGMAVDAQGDVIVIGTTYSANFPLKNAYSSVAGHAGNYPHTMFVSKFNPTGTALVYSTYLGDSTTGNAVAVDTAGNAYAFATTNDPNYPVTAGAFQNLCGANYNNSTGARITGCSTTFATGNNSTALTKISPDGSQLVYSTFLSGNNGQTASAVAVNSAGEAYVTGVTNAFCPAPPYNANGTGYQAYDCFPETANAADSSVALSGGDTVLFLTKFNAAGTGLVYSTVLSNHNPVGHYVSGVKAGGIALDAAGNAYVTGYMDSNYLIAPTTGAYQTAPPMNGLPAFVAKYNPAGTAATSLVYATYLSGTIASNDIATGIAVDASGNAVVTGYTNSCTFPTTPGVLSTIPGGYVSSNICAGGFLTKLNATGTGLVWSTYTGTNGANGRNNDNNDALTLGPDGSVYVVGDDQSVALLPTVNPILTQIESHYTYIKHFAADGSAVVFSSAIGGTTDAASIPAGVAVDATGNIYIAGSTNSSTFPTTAGAFQKTSANPGVNYNDGFIVKIAPTVNTTTTLTLPSGVTAGKSAVLTATVAPVTTSANKPTGAVTFTSGTTTFGTGTLDAGGNASFTVPTLNGTTYIVTASYGGDGNFASSVSPSQNLVVTPATTNVTLAAPSAATVGASVVLTATVTGSGGTPTGTITFKDGSATLGTGTLAAGSASYVTTTLSAGPHSITASYSGDSIFAATVSAASTVTVALTTPTVTLTAPSAALVGASVTLSTTVSGTGGTPTGTVTFKDGATTLGTATLASGSASYTTTALTPGAHSITAGYGGDGAFSQATSAASTVTINVPSAISFAAAPSSLTIVHGASGSVVITATPVGGYTGTVTFACGTLPTAASCAFAPTSLAFTASNTAQSTTLTVSTTQTALLERPLFGASGILAAFLMLPMGCLLRGKRGRRGSLLLLAVLSLASLGAMGLTGCGGSSTPAKTAVTTAPGTYSAVITATTAQGNQTLSIPIVVQ